MNVFAHMKLLQMECAEYFKPAPFKYLPSLRMCKICSDGSHGRIVMNACFIKKYPKLHDWLPNICERLVYGSVL